MPIRPLSRSLLFGLALFFLAPGPGRSQSVQLVPGSEEVTFRIRNAGFWVDGRLGGLEVSGAFDPDQAGQAVLEADVDASSIDTGIDARDEHLKREKYLHISAYPRISIRSRTIRRQGGEWVLEGSLTIKGTTRPVRIPFTALPTPKGYRLRGSFSFNRLDFDVGGKSLILGNTVEVNLQCELEN